MNVFRTAIHDRRIEIPAPEHLRDRTEVLVTLQPVVEKIGLDESEWDVSPAGIAAWQIWLDTLQPIAFPDHDDFDERYRRINIEAVRRQMEGSEP